MPLLNELAPRIALDGEWQFALGPQSGTLQVPGCWEAQGFSKALDGPARCRRTVFIPPEWSGERIFVEFGALSYACALRCNGQPAGEHRGLWAPFAFEISALARPGQDNLLELEIYKPGERYPMRECLAGFLPDVATTFGGIWQPAALSALRLGWEGARVEADPASGTLRLVGRVRALAGGCEQPGLLELSVLHDGSPAASLACPLQLGPDGAAGVDVSISVPDARPWSPASPALYSLRARFSLAGQSAQVTRRFGFRSLQAREGVLFLNGQPLILRGLLSWGWQPDIIAPAYTPASARAEIRRAKALGFNLIKLCLFVPNQAYFEAADEEGILLWQELPLWLPEVTAQLRAAAPREYAEITALVCNHPSAAVYSLGCELNRSVDADLIEALNAAVRGQVRGALVCDNSGSGESYGGLDFDYADFSDYHPYYDLHYFEPLLDNWRRDWLPTRPWIFGEFSDSDGYRDLDELSAANAGQPPWWTTLDNPVTAWRPEALALSEARQRLAQSGLSLPPARLVQIAARQALCARKYTLESLRKRAGMGGYVITGLRDTPIATSGVFDDLERPKSPPAEWLPINSDAILCLDGGRRRRWTHGGDRPAPLDLHNAWAGGEAAWRLILSAFQDLPAGEYQADWRLCGPDGAVLRSGGGPVWLSPQPGRPQAVYSIACALPALESARELRLEAELSGAGLRIANAWPLWLYPRPAWPEGLGLFDPGGALDGLDPLSQLCRRLDDGADWDAPLVLAAGWSKRLEGYLRGGGRVLLLQQGGAPLPAWRGPFWREGLKVFSDHPLWQSFPHPGYAGMQFFGLAGDAAFDPPALAEFLPGLAGYTPILRRLDEREFYVRDYLFEARLGAGRLLGCSLRPQGGLGAQPAGLERNPAGAALLAALLGRLGS